MWLLVVMTYVGPMSPMTPVPLDHYGSHELCEHAAAGWRRQAPPDPKAVWFWATCVEPGVTQAAAPEPASEPKRKGLLGLLW